MRLRFRLIFLLVFLLLLVGTGYLVTGGFLFLITDFWFAAGLLLLLLISLIDQPFFSTDANIFMNGTSGLSLILVESAKRDFWWWVFLVWCFWLLISSYILLWITANKPDFVHPLRTLASKLNRELGRPEALFSAFFLWGAIHQFGIESPKAEPLLAFWVIFMILNLPGISKAIDSYFEARFMKVDSNSDIGSLYRVSDPRVIEIKMHTEAPLQIVGRKVGLKTNRGERIGEAIVIDDRVVAGTRLAKIATVSSTSKWNYLADKPNKTMITIDKVMDPQTEDDIPISVVDVGSTIGFLKFFIHPDVSLCRGEIVWTNNIHNTEVYYQVALASIVENTTIDGNVTKSVLVTAGQLGTWDEKTLRFEPFTWVPPAGQLVYRTCKKKKIEYRIPPSCVPMGNIPFSNFPIHAVINDLVTQNTAIIGVTGSGKSYLAFHLIECLLDSHIKVLILDITREHYLHLSSYKPTQLKIVSDVATWFKSDSFLGINQLAVGKSYPRTTNEFVQAAFDEVSQTPLLPGQNVPAKLCIVFEEAHSLIPEWNQVASQSEIPFVNGTARIILQGRKFGMGSLIITQRTANVTKTILNQCNTIIALRSFDQTGLDFLKNYMGNEYAQTISTLPVRDAILVGKASSSLMPVIFTTFDMTGKWKPNSNPLAIESSYSASEAKIDAPKPDATT